jgi:hypothetical protein
MKKIVIFFLLIIMAFNISACQKGDSADDNTDATEQIPSEITATFNTVEEFKIAIKKDPSQYNGKRISIKAYANPLLSRVYLFDNVPADDELWDDRPRVQVVITDSIKLSVLEDGDYIDLNGVVTITSEEVYLNHCTYTMIKTSEEQKAE